MPLIPLPNNSVIRVQLWSTLAGQAVINHFDYKLMSVPSPSEDYGAYMDALADALGAAGGLIPAYRAAIPSDMTVNRLRLQPVYPTRMRFYDYNLDLPSTYGAPADTANIAGSIERWARTGGRKGLGRISIPIPRNCFLDGVINDAGFMLNHDLLAAEMLQPITTAAPSMTVVPVIMNTQDPNSIPREIEGTIPKRTVRVARRRTVGLGI